MAQDKYVAKPPQCISLEDRKYFSASGVEDVEAFDEEKVVLQTVLGDLTVYGRGLKMGKFNVETGELCLEGQINAICYADSVKKKGFFGRVFG